MFSEKTVRFYLKYAASDPLKFADIVRRRAIEQFAVPPAQLAMTRFNGVRYEIDLLLHCVMKKYFFRTHEMFLERIFDRHLAPDQTFVDIAANCRYWSAYALLRVG